MSTAKINHEVAKLFVGRAEAQVMRGRKRDEMAIEFVVGAAAMAAVIYGQESPEWQAASMFAMMVSLNGYKEVEKFAQDERRQTG